MRKVEDMHDSKWVASEGDSVAAAPGMVLTEKGAGTLNGRRSDVRSGQKEPLRIIMPRLGFGAKHTVVTDADLKAMDTTPF